MQLTTRLGSTVYIVRVFVVVVLFEPHSVLGICVTICCFVCCIAFFLSTRCDEVYWCIHVYVVPFARFTKRDGT